MTKKEPELKMPLALLFQAGNFFHVLALNQ